MTIGPSMRLQDCMIMEEYPAPISAYLRKVEGSTKYAF